MKGKTNTEKSGKISTYCSDPAHQHFQLNCLTNGEVIEVFFENNKCMTKKFNSNQWNSGVVDKAGKPTTSKI